MSIALSFGDHGETDLHFAGKRGAAVVEPPGTQSNRTGKSC
jgi:hypothetical protein